MRGLWALGVWMLASTAFASQGFEWEDGTPNIYEESPEPGEYSALLGFGGTSRKLWSFELGILNRSGARISLALTLARETVSAFDKDAIQPNAYPHYESFRYDSNRLYTRRIALKYQYSLPYDLWVAVAVGRYEVQQKKKLNAEPSYPTRSESPALFISVEKTYLGFSLGWEREISEAYSVGLLATEFVWKGDNSGVEVNVIGDSNTGERERILGSILSFARKDLIESPQLYIRYHF